MRATAKHEIRLWVSLARGFVATPEQLNRARMTVLLLALYQAG
jgi:hypothetical protein